MSRRSRSDSSSAVAYVRVSTDEQALGPEAQRAAVERWAQGNGVRIVGWHEDIGVSGGAPLEERPGLSAALAELQARRAGLLVVAKRDRVARDVLVAAMVERLAERAGARVMAADGTGNHDGPEGQLMRGIVDVFAQYERALIRARTKAALGVKKARGERVGALPLGFEGDGSRLAPNAVEQRAIARVLELRRAGLSIRAIAAALNREGTPARGNRWHPTTVARVLQRIDEAA